MTKTVRAAAVQFHVADDLAANLATCVRLIRAAREAKPDLLVLPEFANHCSWYNDGDHCYEVSLDLDGPFLAEIAEAVRELGAYVVINVTLRRPEHKVSGTSLLYSPQGERLGENDKQVLIGHENDFLTPANAAGPIVDTPVGRLAMYSCMDGVLNETPRCLALRGAQVLCNSLNSFALDEGSLHIPVRAAENKVWVVAANKVGPLIPEAVLEPVAQAINIPARSLDGAGDSQIVAPDGAVVAMAGKAEELIWADIDVSQADSKRRPDGSDIFLSRRPALYEPLCADPADQQIPEIVGPESLIVAAVPVSDGDTAMAAEQIRLAREGGVQLVVLPALLGASDPDQLAADQVVDELAGACGPDTLLACSLPAAVNGALRHDAVLIDHTGIVHRQPQLHSHGQGDWWSPGEAVADVPVSHGRIAVIVSNDAIYPEVFRLLAMQGVHTVAVAGAFQESWEYTTGLEERAAENRVNVVAANAAGACTGFIAQLQTDFTIMTPWKERQFDGLLSAPEVTRSNTADMLYGVVHPPAARNKVCSKNTHLIESRPWRLMDPIAAPIR